jgi:hypothetical protein
MSKIGDPFIKRMFTKSNTLIMVVTIISFMISLILFFTYALSDYPNKIIFEKVDLIIEYSKNDKMIKNKLKTKTDEYFKTRQSEKLHDHEKKRKEHNEALLHSTGILPCLYVAIVVGILVLYYVFTYNKTPYLESCDIILVILAIIAFSIELLFYFIILRNWNYITDAEVLKTIIN